MICEIVESYRNEVLFDVCAGNWSLRTNDSCHGVGRTDERPSICVGFQPSIAFHCGHSRIYGFR